MKRLPVLIMIIFLFSGCDSFLGPAGPKGSPGEKGDTGLQGEQGEIGYTGAQGEKGDSVSQGEQGPPGEKGDIGLQGEQGEIGDSGSPGEKGDSGSQGEQGPPGEKGDTGDTGPQGPQGDGGEVVYTEVAVDEEMGSVLITDAIWTFDEGYYFSGPLVVTGIAKNTGIYSLDYIKIYTKSYDSSGKIISSEYGYAGSISDSLMPDHEIWWKVTDYGCLEKPNKVTLGYSFDVTVVVSAPKISSGSETYLPGNLQ